MKLDKILATLKKGSAKNLAEPGAFVISLKSEPHRIFIGRLYTPLENLKRHPKIPFEDVRIYDHALQCYKRKNVTERVQEPSQGETTLRANPSDITNLIIAEEFLKAVYDNYYFNNLGGHLYDGIIDA